MVDPHGRGRRVAIDVARAGALVLVVAGHLLMAVVDRSPSGELRGANLLALAPQWEWLTVIAPMPVFFAAAGWANARAEPGTTIARLRPLVGLATVVTCVWYLPAAVELSLTGDRGVIGDGARIATQPIWFLAAYLPMAAAGGWMARRAARPVWSVGACLAALAVVDVARFAAGLADGWGWTLFLPAWAVPWLLGCWWRDSAGADPGGHRREVGAGALLAVGATVVAAAMVVAAGYDAALVDAVPGGRSNTSPPTAFTAVAAIGQVGVVMCVAGLLDRWGARHRAAVTRIGSVAVPVYLWHLTALALCSGVVALGMPVPTRLTTWWWLTRPLWWAGVVSVTLLLVVISGALRPPSRAGSTMVGPPGVRHPGASLQQWVGLLLGAAAAAAIGLRGPVSVPVAALTVVALAAGWWLMRAPRTAVDAVDSDS